MKKMFLFLFVLLVAGCTQTAKVTANDGITITSFSASPVSVKSDNTVLFDLQIENTGGTTARNTQVELLGVQQQWRTPSGGTVDTTLPKALGTLRPPDLKTNLPGDFKLAQWELMTPVVPQGIAPQLRVEARVTYDYNTSGRLDIVAVTDKELERQQITGKQVASPVSIVNSAGPIQVNIGERNSQAIVVDTSTTSSQTYPIRIDFVNTGSGFPITIDQSGRPDSGRLRGTIELTGPGISFQDCLGTTSGREVNLDSTDIPTKLKSDGSVARSCTINIDNSIWRDKTQDTISLTFNIFYTYYTTSTTSVTVFGR